MINAAKPGLISESQKKSAHERQGKALTHLERVAALVDIEEDGLWESVKELRFSWINPSSLRKGGVVFVNAERLLCSRVPGARELFEISGSASQALRDAGLNDLFLLQSFNQLAYWARQELAKTSAPPSGSVFFLDAGVCWVQVGEARAMAVLKEPLSWPSVIPGSIGGVANQEACWPSEANDLVGVALGRASVNWAEARGAPWRGDDALLGLYRSIAVGDQQAELRGAIRPASASSSSSKARSL